MSETVTVEVLSKVKTWDPKYKHLERLTVPEILTTGYLAVLKIPLDIQTLEIRRGVVEDIWEVFMHDRVDAIAPAKFQDLMERGVLENWIATSIDRLKSAIYKRAWSYDAKNHFKEEHWTLRRMLETALPKKEYLLEVAGALEDTQKVFPTFDGSGPTIAHYRLMNRTLRQSIISRLRHDPIPKK